MAKRPPSVAMQGDTGLGHKDGCVYLLNPQPGVLHRAPIECVTVPEFWAALDQERKKVEELEEQATTLKAALYDFEHRDD